MYGANSSSDDSTFERLNSKDSTRAAAERYKAMRKKSKKTHATTRNSNKDGQHGSLCVQCRKITLFGLRSPGIKLYGGFGLLRKSADSCAMCDLIFSVLRHRLANFDHKLVNGFNVELNAEYGDHSGLKCSPNFGKWHREREDLISLTMDQSQGGEIQIRAMDIDHEETMWGLKILCKAMIYTPSEDFSTSNHVPMDLRLRGDEKFSLIETWLKEDLKSIIHHEETVKIGAATRCGLCPNPVYTGDMCLPNHPRRLLYLGQGPELERQQLRLVTFAEACSLVAVHPCLEMPRYVALSHRWGTNLPFIACKANLSALSQGFSFEDLPRTFKDAATISVRLGFRLLWIDALCIVQDDALEWSQESETMGDIYASACFTIASHCSEDSKQGFLEAALRKRGGVQLQDGITYVRPHADLKTDLSNSPLSRRGWVLQERFLSRNILHLTPAMLYWETAALTKSEDYPQGFTDVRIMDCSAFSGGPIEVTSIPYNLRTLRQFGISANLDLGDFSAWLQSLRAPKDGHILTTPTTVVSLNKWYHLVERYSLCSLTKPRDKLMAISGIAKVVQRQRKSQYLAGIWADGLPAGLWWLHVGRRGIHDQTRAPSWSWAAMDGPTQFPLADDHLRLRINCEVINDAANDADWLNEPGQLRMRAEVLDLRGLLSRGVISIKGKYRSTAELDPLDSAPLENDQEFGVQRMLSQWDALCREGHLGLRLFNVDNVQRIELRDDSPSTTSRAWCIMDSLTYENPFKQDNMLCASVASVQFEELYDDDCGSMATFSKKDIRLHFVVLITPTTNDPSYYRRIGVGVIDEEFVNRLRKEGNVPTAAFRRKWLTLI